MSTPILSSQHKRNKAILERRLVHLKERISGSDFDLKYDMNEMYSIRYALKLFSLFESIVNSDEVSDETNSLIRTLLMDNCPEEILENVIKYRDMQRV